MALSPPQILHALPGLPLIFLHRNMEKPDPRPHDRDAREMLTREMPNN